MQFKKSDYVTLANFRNSLRRFLHETSEAARQHGMTPQQHQVLLAIKGAEGREWLSVGDLAKALQVRHHSMVALIDRCELAGLVKRGKGELQDRRVARISLTPKGDKILEKLSVQNRRELNLLRTALQMGFPDEPK